MDTQMNAPETPPPPAQNGAHKARGRPFERGRSGNASGRPKGHRNKATMAMEELLDGEAEALTRKLVEKALEGDIAALRLCLDRLLPPRRDRPVVFELPQIESAKDALAASSAILAVCAAGKLSPSEAAELMGLVAIHVRMFEVTETEAGLAAFVNATLRGQNRSPARRTTESNKPAGTGTASVIYPSSAGMVAP
jgi:hypothetical protein